MKINLIDFGIGDIFSFWGGNPTQVTAAATAQGAIFSQGKPSVIPDLTNELEIL